MIEKICARLEEEREIAYADFDKYANDYELDLDDTYDDFFHNGLARAKTIVQEVAKEYDWIPVSERLPEPFQRVLVYDAWDDSMTIEHLQENDSFIDSVVAWMPLPIAPYQKGK